MIEEKVLETITKMRLIHENDKIVVGVSGGPDSMCLLDILYCLKEKLNIELVVAHVNHMMRKEAEEETKYTKEFCKKIEVPVFIKYANIENLAKQQKRSTEEMGRNVRYEFFEEVAKKVGANKVATAHTANDNCETVLMNIIRGTGISGLKGIEMLRTSSSIQIKENNNEINLSSKEKDEIRLSSQNSNKIEENYIKELIYIRPIRNLTRSEVEEYCKQKKLNPQIDKSNYETIYTRNKIRNELIPYLQKEYNPNIVETINRLSEIAKEDETYFAKTVKQAYETLKIEENEKEIILNLKEFNKLEKVIKTRLILYTINKLNKTVQGIGKVHLDDIILLCEKNIGNKFLMPNKSIKIFVKQGKIHFISTI